MCAVKRDQLCRIPFSARRHDGASGVRNCVGEIEQRPRAPKPARGVDHQRSWLQKQFPSLLDLEVSTRLS